MCMRVEIRVAMGCMYIRVMWEISKKVDFDISV